MITKINLFIYQIQLAWISYQKPFVEGLLAAVILAFMTLISFTFPHLSAVCACLIMFFIVRNNIYLDIDNCKGFALGYLLFSIFFIPPTITIFYFIMFIVMKKSGF